MTQEPTTVQSTTLPIALDWLKDGAPQSRCGVNWGVPWPQGKVQNGQSFALEGGGAPLAVQSWPLAFWPDGSLKWTGHAFAAHPQTSTSLRLSLGTPAAPQTPLAARESENGIEIENDAMRCRIAKSGANFLKSLEIGGNVVARDGHLICLLEDRSQFAAQRVTREEEFHSRIESAALEQAGPVRAVVKIEGVHRSGTGREWLPFTLRLYFFAGVASIRAVHSFVFDGEGERDFIRGLGVRFSIPLRDEAHNRHVRLAGEEGLWAEPVRVIAGRSNASPDLYQRQIAGEVIPPLAELPNAHLISKMAVWDSWKLTQISADSFSLWKRTGAHSAWVGAGGAARSLGLAFAGDSGGGLALGMKDFWQLHPTGLEIEGAASQNASITLWLWSPDAPAMDLRHYDIEEHDLDASYEDIEPGYSTAHGIARTSELTLCPFASPPPNEELLALARTVQHPPRLICEPHYLHSVPVFGVWSLPDRSSAGKNWIEDQLDDAITFYQNQIEGRKWFGFWDYGDVMHSYDPTRHVWRYDIGGFAWANSELVPDLWLWTAFLRSGRADIFQMAEAMTRHTQEVDVYHLGPLAPLGSRHNVRHWGCGAKEARISQALLKRIYFYLTTDERTGDLMDAVRDADFTTVRVDPLRKLEAPSQFPTHARVGPDWFAFCSNWLAAWERTGDPKWRDKILVGMKCMSAMPHGLFSGFCYGYDPQDGSLHQLSNSVEVPHLAALMGGPELMMELAPLLDNPAWNAAWLHYCRLLQAPQEEQIEVLGAEIDYARWPHYCRMTAYAARETGDATLAARAWQIFLQQKGDTVRRSRFEARLIEGADVPFAVPEAPLVSTNDTAQWCLNAMQLLELAGASLPENHPLWNASPCEGNPDL
ncbi:MAG: hypothetical protein KY445_06560 [Armatimonadetes bacterium]|nr:hypothetical protein [Armatimonadota bacterium]